MLSDPCRYMISWRSTWQEATGQDRSRQDRTGQVRSGQVSIRSEAGRKRTKAVRRFSTGILRLLNISQPRNK